MFLIASCMTLDRSTWWLIWGTMQIAISSHSKDICSNDILYNILKPSKLIINSLEILCCHQAFIFALTRKFIKSGYHHFLSFTLVWYMDAKLFNKSSPPMCWLYLEINCVCETFIFFPSVLENCFGFTVGSTASQFVSKVTNELSFRRTIITFLSSANSESYELL